MCVVALGPQKLSGKLAASAHETNAENRTIGRYFFEARLQLVYRNVNRAFEPAGFPFMGPSNVDYMQLVKIFEGGARVHPTRLQSVAMTGLIRFADQRRYLLLSSSLVVLMTILTFNEQWSLDFLEHAAVVRELATHPLDPVHPLLPIDVPHPYFSPYLLGIAMLARWLDIGTTGAMQIAALFNLMLFMLAFRLFVTRVVRSSNAAFYALLFSVVLWGLSPWRWSGYLNFNSLGFTLPYPSMFAFPVMLLTLSALISYLSKPRPLSLVGMTIGGALVLLTHPITAAAGAVFGAALLAAHFRWRDKARYLAILGAGLLAVLLAVAWPYFSVLDLFSESSIYHSSHPALYQKVLQRTFPALVALPILVRRFRSDPRDPLVLSFLGMTAVYLWGFLSEAFTYGRMMPFVMLILHITLGSYFADLEIRARAGSTPIRPVGLAYAGLSLLMVVGLIGAAPGLVRTIPHQWLPERLRIDPRLAKISDTYGFLSTCTRQYEVVLTDLGLASMAVPAFGGKVVATAWPIPYIADKQEREADVRAFFGSASAGKRRAIVAKHDVSYVLLEARQFNRFGGDIGKESARHGELVLVSTAGRVCTADTN